MKKAIVSWSSGKDSCLACHKAINMGYDIKYLFNTISDESKRVNFHGTSQKLLKAQSEAAGIPLFQIETSGDDYTEKFKEGVSGLIDNEGIETMVFGDIYLQWHKDWIDDVCNELGVEAVMPLWNRKSEEIVNEVISFGFEAIIVGVSAKHVKNPEILIGRWIDNEFINFAKNNVEIVIIEDSETNGFWLNNKFIDCSNKNKGENGFDICGENGEYHTFVTAGPLFKKKINIIETERVYKEKEYKERFTAIGF